MATVNDPIDFSKLLYTLQVVEDSSRDSDHFCHFPNYFFEAFIVNSVKLKIGGLEFG